MAWNGKLDFIVQLHTLQLLSGPLFLSSFISECIQSEGEKLFETWGLWLSA